MTHFLNILDQEIAAQERILEDHPAYIKLQALRATRAVYLGSVDSVASQPLQALRVSLDAAFTRKRTAPLGGKSLEAVNASIEILRDRGKPMRTAELMPLLAERNIVFSGDAPQNIVSSLLSRSADVVSKGGHIGWALKAWESEESGSSAEGQPSSDDEPNSAPVEPGEGVAHEKIG